MEKRTPLKYSFHPIDKRIVIEYFYGVFIGSGSGANATTILTRKDQYEYEKLNSKNF